MPKRIAQVEKRILYRNVGRFLQRTLAVLLAVKGTGTFVSDVGQFVRHMLVDQYFVLYNQYFHFRPPVYF